MKIKINIAVFVLFLSAFYKGVIEFAPFLDSYASYINLFIDVSITALGLSVILQASRKFVVTFFILIIISSLTFLVTSGTLFSQHLNGLREISDVFFAFILFDVIVKEGYLNEFNLIFKKFALVFLILQLPVCFIQYLKYTAGDNVGGTYGIVGGSGVLSITLFLLIYYLIENKGNDRTLIAKTIHLCFLSIFLIPIVINETKISFILIPLMIGTFINLRQIGGSIFLLVFSGIFFLFFASNYSDQGSNYKNPVTEIFSNDFLDSYLAGDVVNYEDIPRFTKIQISVALLSKDASSLLLGAEYGAFKGGTTVQTSVFATKYEWLLFGTNPYIFYLFITGGICLVLLLLYLFYSEIFRKNDGDEPKFSKGLLLFLGIVFTMVLFYNDAFRNQAFLLIFVYLIFYSRYNQPEVEEEEA